jgi:zinc transport system permease protein
LAKMMLLSSLFSSIFTIIGLIISYIYNISSGASIILISALSLLLFLLFINLKSK